MIVVGDDQRGDLPPPPRPPSWLEVIAGSVIVAVWLGFVVGHWLGMWGG